DLPRIGPCSSHGLRPCVGGHRPPVLVESLPASRRLAAHRSGRAMARTTFRLLPSAFCLLLLLSVDGKCQKQIARLSHDAPITRVGVKHTVGYGRPSAIDRPTFGQAAVYGVNCLRRIVIPNNRSVPGRIGPQMSVGRAGKNHAWNQARGRRLGVVAPPRTPTTSRWRRRHLPNLLTCRDAQRRDSRLAAWSGNIGVRYVDILLISSKSPLDATQSAPDSQPRLPERFALLIRIQS